MKINKQLKYAPVLLLLSISVSADNNFYQIMNRTIKNIPLSKCQKYSTLIMDSNGHELARFDLPNNKINRTLRNNKRLFLYNLGIIKNYSYETNKNPGYPHILKCHLDSYIF